ncbi:MAG: response regulator [Anaerolineae bacterium]|nr:response regulator [Anaerolineae bacterium]
MRVLIAEDNIDSRQLVEDILTGLDIEVLAAPDGLQALELARTASPDLIILDINMPGLSGFEVCARLKADAALATIPVLMLTALDQVDDRVKALGLGADDYLTKPFNPRELVARVNTRLRAKQEADLLRAAQQQMRSTFERFVAPEVVQQLLADPTHVALGGGCKKSPSCSPTCKGSARFRSTWTRSASSSCSTATLS